MFYFTGKRYKIMTTDTAEYTDDILEQVGNLTAIAVVAHLGIHFKISFGNVGKQLPTQ